MRPADVIDPVQTEWLNLLQAAISVPPRAADDDCLTRQLGGYRCLVESWEQAFQAGSLDPTGDALRALAQYAQNECLEQIRAWLSAGPIWDAMLRLPLLPVVPAAFLSVPGGGEVWTAWRALVDYRTQVEHLCALYQSVGADTLARLEAALGASADPPIDSLLTLYAWWQSCQDGCEALIVRGNQFGPRLAAAARSVAALRAAHQQWCTRVAGVGHDVDTQKALSEEIAAIRRQLRVRSGPGP